jgi:hypothetical protein
MKRIVISIVIISLLNIPAKWANSQDTNLSLKVGAAKILNAPASTIGFAYKTFAPASPYPALHLEFKKKDFLNKRIALLAGISGIPTFGEFTLNKENIKSGYSRSSRYSYYSLQLYTGIELSFRNPKKKPFRNYFSIFSTVGFNFSAGEELTPEILADDGITNNGGVFTGSRYTVEQGKFLSPSLQAGVRYHITNSKGREIIALELMTNYNLSRYFSYTFRYQIDGVDKVDYVAEKGFNIQFNVIVPLFNFSKSKKQR